MFSYKILEWEKLSRQVPRYDVGEKMQDLTVDLSNKKAASSKSSAAEETAFSKRATSFRGKLCPIGGATTKTKNNV